MRLRRLLPLTILTALFFLPSPLAQAHAELVSSTPAAGSHLDTLPTQVEVTFDGNLLAIGGSNPNVLMVKDSQGTRIDTGNSHVSGASLSVGLQSVSTTGRFEVSWRVVSSDGHPEEGSYLFTVGKIDASATPTPSASAKPVAPVPGESFWVRYGTRVMLAVLGMLSIGIWFRFERARRKTK